MLGGPGPGLGCRTGPCNPDSGRALDASCIYTHNDIGAGSAARIAAGLIGAAPGCSFYLWTDPDEDCLGSLRAYTPKLGLFQGACDSDGMVYATGKDVKMAFEGALTERRRYGSLPVSVADLDAIRDAVDRLFGGPRCRDWIRARDRAARQARENRLPAFGACPYTRRASRACSRHGQGWAVGTAGMPVNNTRGPADPNPAGALRPEPGLVERDHKARRGKGQ